MLHRLWGRVVAEPKHPDVAARLYDATAAQARLPAFFRSFGFSDTVLGKLDVLHLHLFLLTHRLGAGRAPGLGQLSQEIFDRHIDALDLALRQLGVGDLSVPKRKKRMVRDFYGLVAAFDPLWRTPEKTAIAAMANRRFLGDGAADMAVRLAEYLIAAAGQLAALADEELLAGTLTWPQPQETDK